jgi:hypothetical protein
MIDLNDLNGFVHDNRNRADLLALLEAVRARLATLGVPPEAPQSVSLDEAKEFVGKVCNVSHLADLAVQLAVKIGQLQ